MNKSLKIIFGLILIAAGVLWALNILDVVSFSVSTKGWWTLFIIVPCVYRLFTDHNKVGPFVGIGVGVLLLLAAREIITWQMMWQLCLALLIVGFGLRLILYKGCCRHEVSEFKTISSNGKKIHRVEYAFGKQQLSFAGQKFEGADVEFSFGGFTLDLNGAEITEDAFINLNVGFSGVTIIVPENLCVKISVSSGFGGVTDKRRVKPDSGSPVLYINGKVGFGGVEIRN